MFEAAECILRCRSVVRDRPPERSNPPAGPDIHDLG